MIKYNIEDKIKEIVSEVIEVEKSNLNIDSGIGMELPEWDSFAHLQILMSVEDFFKIKFNVKEIQTLTSIKTIYRAVNNLIE